MNFLQNIGALGIIFAKSVVEYLSFLANSIKNAFTPPFYPKEVLRQVIEIGFYSLPVVALTSLFAGMVLAVQSYSGFSQFSANSAVATVLSIAITRELGPVFAGLMVAGRIGATFAAHIGTMKVSEQIDALTTLKTNPFKYLFSPRIIASVIALPFLVFLGDIIGIFGGFLVATNTLGFNAYTFIKNIYNAVAIGDLTIGLVKGAVFGLIISSLGCYFGNKTRGGAEGVGKATTNAVVVSSILILIANYIITAIFFEGT